MDKIEKDFIKTMSVLIIIWLLVVAYCLFMYEKSNFMLRIAMGTPEYDKWNCLEECRWDAIYSMDKYFWIPTWYENDWYLRREKCYKMTEEECHELWIEQCYEGENNEAFIC